VPRGDQPRPAAARRRRRKGTVTLHDFEHADTLLIFGQNQPQPSRMMGELRDCLARGATIVSINPLRERGLERFTTPQSPAEMLTGATRSASSSSSQTGGDFALIKGHRQARGGARRRAWLPPRCSTRLHRPQPAASTSRGPARAKAGTCCWKNPACRADRSSAQIYIKGDA
jgi:hypothetical protein